jgi:hypothetical protein
LRQPPVYQLTGDELTSEESSAVAWAEPTEGIVNAGCSASEDAHLPEEPG